VIAASDGIIYLHAWEEEMWENVVFFSLILFEGKLSTDKIYNVRGVYQLLTASYALNRDYFYKISFKLKQFL